MIRLFLSILALTALCSAQYAAAEPGDIAAAERGVVRVVVIGAENGEVYPVSHGTGFAVSPTRIVTNAHVVAEALEDDTLRVGIVTSQGDEAVYARIISVSTRNDLALIEATGNLRLPPLTIAGGDVPDNGEVTAVGYPMNVDRAQGLEIGDIFRSQPAVKARGFVSGSRPSRQFDTILHTAPIARGNSGGPILDNCGRVLGVNSFGADSDSSDAEFFFAVSTRELIPFLKANKVEARINAQPCRSFAELDADERERMERENSARQARLAAEASAMRDRRDRVRLEAEQGLQVSRENAMALAFLLAMASWSAGGYAAYSKRRAREDKRIYIAAGASAVLAIAAVVAWVTRPGLDELDRRISDALAADAEEQADDTGIPADGQLLCTFDETRSRIVGSAADDIALDWTEDGCINARTQYGVAANEWTRIFVPQSEDAVSVNTFDPQSLEFRTDRYLLSRSAIADARRARNAYTPPQCGTPQAATRLGEMQGAVSALLPARPNERLVYRCTPRNGGQ